METSGRKSGQLLQAVITDCGNAFVVLFELTASVQHLQEKNDLPLE